MNFTAPIRMYFLKTKSTLDSLKSVFNVFRRKPSLGAPEDTQALKNTVEKLKTQNRTRFNGKKDSKGLTRDCRCNLSPMISIGN